MVTLQLLGGLNLVGPSGAEVSVLLSHPKRIAVLAFLALEGRDGYLTRDRLVSLFWEESDAARARNSLSQVLHVLRRELGASALRTRGKHDVGLDPDRIECDVWAFRDALEAMDYQTALAHYKGDLLAGFHLSNAGEFERWLEEERGSLRELAAGAAWRVAHAHLARQDPVEAERTAQRALSLIWSDEAPVRDFIRSLAEAGDRASALRLYEKFSAKLQEELGVEPSPATMGVAEGIRNGELTELLPPMAIPAGEPGDAPSGAPPEPALEPLPSPPATPGIGPGSIPTEGRRIPGWGSGWAWGGIGAGALLLLAGVYLGLVREGGGELRQRNVLVTVFENRTGDPALDVIGEMATHLVIGKLGQMGPGTLQVQPMHTAMSLHRASSSSRIRASEAGPGCVPGRTVKARIQVSGFLYPHDEGVRVHTEVMDVEECKQLWSLEPMDLSVEAPATDLASLAETVAVAVVSHLEPEPGRSWLAEGTTPSLSVEAFRALQVASDALREGDLWRGESHLLRALELDSAFVAARLSLILVYLSAGTPYYAQADSNSVIADAFRDRISFPEQAWLDYSKAAIRGDREGAYLWARRMAESSGAAVDLTNVAREAINTNRPREAKEALSRLDPEQPDLAGNPYLWRDLMRAHHMLGEFQQAMTVARMGRRQLPDDRVLAVGEGCALAALGEAAEAKALADELQDRWGPGYGLIDLGGCLLTYGHGEIGRAVLERVVGALREPGPEELEDWRRQARLGDALLLLGRLDEGRAVLSEASAQVPTNIGIIVSLGVASAQLGDTAGAWQIFRRIGETDRPYGLGDYPLGQREYYQAWIAAQLGELDLAVNLLEEAHRNGKMLGSWLHTSVYLLPLRGYPPFEDFIKPKG